MADSFESAMLIILGDHVSQFQSFNPALCSMKTPSIRQS